MNRVHSLSRELKAYLPWHQARINFLSQFLIALIQVRTVNLTEIALAFSGQAQANSAYKRLQRFFRHFELDFDQLARVIVRWLDLGERWILCLDRTNWQFGQFKINILVLSVAYRGAAVPLFWTLLDKKGNSSTAERIELMQRFLKVFPHERIQCLTADREFRGQKWLNFLKAEHIPFRLRIPNNTRTDNKYRNTKIPVSRLFALRRHETMTLNKPRSIWGVSVYLSCVRSAEEHVIIATDHAPATALADYRRRWEIETLFACLKTRGFNLEQTHLRHRERIARVFALLVLAFCWCYKTGIWKNQKQPIRVKKHQRLAKSLFRYGLDHLREILLNQQRHPLDFHNMIRLLSCT